MDVSSILWDIGQLGALEGADTSDLLDSLQSGLIESLVGASPIDSSSPLQASPLQGSDQDSQDQENEEDDDAQIQKKRKRQDVRNQCEAKRRNKFNEQIDALRSLLFANIDAKQQGKTRPKITREALMTAAIQEIMKLRQEKSDAKWRPGMIETTSSLQQLQQRNTELLLSDPFNRSAYTTTDLENAFQTMLSRELHLLYHSNVRRTDESYHTIQTLKDMSKQIGKTEFQLSVGVLEQMYHLTIKGNMKELGRCLEQNWNMYQNSKKGSQKFMLFGNSEVGTYILSQMSWLENMTGNFAASERTYKFAKDLAKKFNHDGTTQSMLVGIVWNLRGVVSVATAQKIRSILPELSKWTPTGTFILGQALVAAGRHREGLDAIEQAMFQFDGKALHLGPAIIDAFIQTRNIDRGLALANYFIQKYSELNIEGYFSKPELLRQKAVLLMMKRFPDFYPDPAELIDSIIEEIIENTKPVNKTNEVAVYGPALPVQFQIPSEFYHTENTNEDIEMILRSAMNLAHSRGVITVELRCAVDLTRFFVFSADMHQALETVNLVKDCLNKVKGTDESREIRRAKSVLAMVEDLQRWL